MSEQNAAVSNTQQQQLSVWTNANEILEIKKMFGNELTEPEFGLFLKMGQALDLNPFMREIYAVKYAKGTPAQIFVGRDGYRKVAQRHPQYDTHLVEAVYSNDKFSVDNGFVKHEYSFSDRGNLVGAYALVYRHGASRPVYNFVKFTEYVGNGPIWKTKPETMIKKVAEAQALRMAFQNVLGGTYDESEDWTKNKDAEKPQVANRAVPVRSVGEGKVVQATGEIIEQAEELFNTHE